MDDISIELLKGIKKSFSSGVEDSKTINDLLKKLDDKKRIMKMRRNMRLKLVSFYQNLLKKILILHHYQMERCTTISQKRLWIQN